MIRLSIVWLTGLLVLLQAGCKSSISESAAEPWDRADEIVRQIQEPVIPQAQFKLSDYGGVGDGKADNKAAFDSVIKACELAGGGTIAVEAGDYLVNGPIHLKSHMNLHLEEGAKLIFGHDPNNYLPVVLTSWEGTRCYNYSPFIYAFGATDVAISGKGEIDGNASESWNNWKQLQDSDKKLIRKMNNQEVPLEERIFGEGHYLRPQLVQFYECENILVEDVKITDSPFWCLHFVYSKDITVRGLTYEAFNYNNDGIDPESSSNILIEGVTFNNGDDNIAIKAGRDLEARTLGIPSSNIVIRDCKFSGYNAIAVGSEMSGGVHEVFVENCSYAGKVIYGIYLKGNRDRGGMVHDIYARNILFDTTRATIIIDSNYKNQGECCPPVFKNIFIENITAAHASDYGIFLKGSPQKHLDSIFISDVQIGSAGEALNTSYTDQVEMKRVQIGGEFYKLTGGVPELKKMHSSETGRELWQISSDTAPAVACYFERQAFTSDEKYLVYASRSSGAWRLKRMNLKTGVARAITPEGRKVMDDDYTIMPDGERVCYLDGWKLYALHVERMEEELLFDYSGLLPDQPLYTGSFTSDGIYTLVYIRGDTSEGAQTAIYRTNLETGEIRVVHEQPGGKITHPLINPENPNIISYVPGPDTQNDMSLPMEQRARSWKVDLEAGTDMQFLTVPYGYRATHESWSKDGERFFFFRKTRPGWSPVAICSQDKNGGGFRLHYESDSIRLGHGTVSYDGRWFVADSQEPGKNELVLVNLENGEARVLCWPNSSVSGGHDMRAHVHPSFSPKGNYVCYTSDQSGVSQVYVVPVRDLTAFREVDPSVQDDFEAGHLAAFWRPGGAGHGRYVDGTITLTDEFSRNGDYSLRMDIRDTSIMQDDGEGSYTERTELDSRKRPLVHQEVEISYSLLIPEDFPVVDTRLVISQIKQSGLSVGPVVAQRFRNGRHYLTIRKLRGKSKKQLKFDLPALEPGTWHDMKIEVYFSAQKNGLVKFWMDGEQVVSFRGRTAHFRGDNKFYHKIGLYRDHMDQPMSIYFDDYKLRSVKPVK